MIGCWSMGINRRSKPLPGSLSFQSTANMRKGMAKEAKVNVVVVGTTLIRVAATGNRCSCSPYASMAPNGAVGASGGRLPSNDASAQWNERASCGFFQYIGCSRMQAINSNGMRTSFLLPRVLSKKAIN